LLGAVAPKTEDGRIVGTATAAVSAAEDRMNSRRESEAAVLDVFITESPGAKVESKRNSETLSPSLPPGQRPPGGPAIASSGPHSGAVNNLMRRRDQFGRAERSGDRVGHLMGLSHLPFDVATSPSQAWKPKP
jgi:hypothetical protein